MGPPSCVIVGKAVGGSGLVEVRERTEEGSETPETVELLEVVTEVEVLARLLLDPMETEVEPVDCETVEIDSGRLEVETVDVTDSMTDDVEAFAIEAVDDSLPCARDEDERDGVIVVI